MRRAPLVLALWAALAAIVPVPFFLVQIGREPVAGMLHLLGICLWLVHEEGSAGAVATAAALLAAQAAIAGLLLLVGAFALERVLRSAFGARRTLVASLLCGAAFLAALAAPIYVTPFRSAGLHSTWLELFE